MPIIAEKFNKKKERNEKLKEVKARLNFGGGFGTSRYSESKTMSTMEHERRHRSRRSRSPRPRPSVFSRIRRELSRSPRQKPREKEGGVFKRLGNRGKSVSACSGSHNQHSYSKYIEALSKSEDNRGGHWKSRSKKQKSSREGDDLSQPRSEDPEDHLKIFQKAAQTEWWAMPIWCHMFNSTLTGNARVWFDDLPSESIDSYADLKKAFLENCLQQKKCIKDPIELHNIKQRDGESTEDFVRRSKLESRDVKGAPECMRISGFVHGITNPELIKRLHDKIPKTVNEMMRVTTSFLRGEVATLNHERKKSFLPWKQQKGKFKAPPPMTTPVEKRNHAKFCEFHGEVGHNTDECMHLKKQIEEMIKAGKLSHLIKELKQNNGKEQPKTTKKGETSMKEKVLAILMVQHWEKVARQKITQSFSPNTEIFFPPLDENKGTEGPMIIEAEIGGHCIHRMYVDGGSASEILYEHCFNRLRPEIKNQLVIATTPLIGFSGEIIWPIGQIQLLVRIGDEEHSASAWMNFVVVRSPSSYNGIIERPGVRKLQAVLSTAHEMLKLGWFYWNARWSLDQKRPSRLPNQRWKKESRWQ
ncbi:reverse transcriptase domain-containing protein [Tanacetum coccineum]